MDKAGRTRRAYIVEALLEYMIALLVIDAFLAAILKQVGVSDAVTGIVSSFISFACVAQLFSASLVRRGRSMRKMILILDLINQLMFTSLYLTPFLPIPQGVKVGLFVVLILGAYLILNTTFPLKYKWLNSFVNPGERGRFTARKEIVSLIGGMVFSLAMGCLVDHFKAIGQERTGFILCGVTLFVVAILHFVSLLLCSEAPEEAESAPKDTSLSAAFRLIAKSPDVRRLLVIDVLWKIASYISTPYYGTYLIGELGFSLTFVSILHIAYSLVRAVFSPWFGRIGDRRGWASLLTLGLVIIAAGYLVNTFTTPAHRYLYVVYYTLYAVAMASVNTSLCNMNYDYLDEAVFSEALGARNAISGVIGFLASLLGGVIVGAIQGAGNRLFGIPVYAQQVNSLIALVVVLALIVYMHTVIRRRPRRAENASR